MYFRINEKSTILCAMIIFILGSGASRADHQPLFPPVPGMVGCEWQDPNKDPNQELTHTHENEYGNVEECLYGKTYGFDGDLFPGWGNKPAATYPGGKVLYPLSVKRNCAGGAWTAFYATCPEPPPVAPAVQPPPPPPPLPLPPEGDHEDCPECEKVDACFDAGGSPERCCSIIQDDEIRKECMQGPMDCPECEKVDACFEKGGSPRRCCSIMKNPKEQQICLKHGHEGPK